MRSGEVLIAIALCAGASACAFDESGFGGFGAGSDAGGPGPDAGVRPDAAPGGPDARPMGTPDAAPPGPGTVVSRRTATPPELDGDLDDWGGAVWTRFDIADAAHTHALGSYTASFQVDFASLHDDDHIYLAFVVKDDVAGNDSTAIWNDDSLSIFLDAGGDATGPFGPDDHELLIGSDGLWQDYAASPLPGAALAGIKAGSAVEWVLEISLDKSMLGAGGSLPDVLGFDLAINDDDGIGNSDVDAYGLWFESGRPSCVSCCTGQTHGEAWCDTTVFGQLVLMP